LTFFGLAFIPLINLLAQPWNTVESAFKYIIAVILVLWVGGQILFNTRDTESARNAVIYTLPFVTFG